MSQKVTEQNSLLLNLIGGGSQALLRELDRRKRISEKFYQIRRFGIIPLFVYDRMQTGYADNHKLGQHVTFGRAHTFSKDLVLLEDTSRGDIYAEINKKVDSKRVRGELMGVSPETFLEICSEMNYLRMYPRKVQIMPEESTITRHGSNHSAYQAAYMFITKDELTLKGLQTKRLPTRSFGNAGNPRVKDKSFFEMMEDKKNPPKKSYKESAEEELDSYADFYMKWSEMSLGRTEEFDDIIPF